MASKKRFREQQATRRIKQRFVWIAIAAIAAVILIGLAIIELSTSSTPSGATLLAKCDDVQDSVNQDRHHIAPDETPIYQSNPPTGGPHYPDWIRAGIYNSPQDQTKLVHSLEHGYIVIYHRDLDANEFTTLANLARSIAYKIVVNPYPNNPARVITTAWDHVQKCDGVNEQAIRDFIARYRETAPESTSP